MFKNPDAKSNNPIKSGTEELQLPTLPPREFTHPLLNGVSLPNSRYVIADLSFREKATRTELIQLVRELDGQAVITAGEVRTAARHLFNESTTCDPELLKGLCVNGLTEGYKLSDLLKAAKGSGPEILVIFRSVDQAPVGYLTYFSGNPPAHFEKLAEVVSDVTSIEEKKAFVDTVVVTDPNCRGGYKQMMAEAIREYRLKCPEVSRVFAKVRVYPNPNEASSAHRALGWEELRDGYGDVVTVNEEVCPEAYGDSVAGVFNVVYFSLYSKHAERLLREASRNTDFQLLQLDGTRRER